jgi:hypothetical protein
MTANGAAMEGLDQFGLQSIITTHPDSGFVPKNAIAQCIIGNCAHQTPGKVWPSYPAYERHWHKKGEQLPTTEVDIQK